MDDSEHIERGIIADWPPRPANSPKNRLNAFEDASKTVALQKESHKASSIGSRAETRLVLLADKWGY